MELHRINELYIVGIGASAGGLEAMLTVRLLGSISWLKAVLAQNGDKLQP
jgi:hypothetical protein